MGEDEPGGTECSAHLAVDASLPLRLVAALASAGADVLLVSHQPAVEELVRTLVHPAGVPLPAGFRTATIVALELGDGAASWRPAWVADPHRLTG